jgi:protocatechuate 3,4-dioxygenase beta subunit
MQNDRIDGMTRRAFAGSALAAAAALASGAKGAETPLRPTAFGDLGPFYPIERLAEEDADLTWIKGHAKRASGDVIEVSGRVLDRHGNPVRGAILEVWQANSLGRYAHANDIAKAPLDPDFQGYARIRTGAGGDWRITTIKPAAYDSPIGRRTPHIHFDVHGKSQRLITQMYFSDDAATNAADMLYKGLGDWADTALAKLDTPAKYRWDVVMMDG